MDTPENSHPSGVFHCKELRRQAALQGELSFFSAVCLYSYRRGAFERPGREDDYSLGMVCMVFAVPCGYVCTCLARVLPFHWYEMLGDKEQYMDGILYLV